jgi:hypothetical protein
MDRAISSVSVRIAALLTMTGCAGHSHSHSVRPPEVPATLQVPSGQSPFLEARASGVQIYQCVSRPDAPGAFGWVFQAPEATLINHRGRPIGRHYAGPTWELSDGSRVAGEVVAHDPGPDPTAIPWLLLRAKSASGTGRLSDTQSIQRVRTAGGVAPSAPCSAAAERTLVRVPYSASYVFYR